MSAIKDGGPAFPAMRREQVGTLADHGYDDDTPTYDDVSYPGMSLRDWFAGRALAAIIEADGIQFATRQQSTPDSPMRKPTPCSQRGRHPMSSLLLHRTRMAIHNEPSAYPHFRLIGAKEAARLAAEGFPFTEHCHGETVTTLPREPETVTDMLIKMAVGIVCVLVIVALVGVGFADWNHAQMLMARV